MPHTLEMNAFRQCDHKVKLLAFHPTKPWLAYADKGLGYGIVDWETQQTVLEGVAGQGEDQQSVDQALIRLAEKNPEFYGVRSTDGSSLKSSAFGTIRDLCFIDLESCFWQTHRFQGPESSLGHAKYMQMLGKAQSLRAHSWLVLICDSKVHLQDLRSHAVHDISRAVLENKLPTCVAVLYLNSSKLVSGNSEGAQKSGNIIQPILAVGTSSGVIYLLSTETHYCYARLVGGHKSGVNRIQAIPGRNTLNPEEGLVSAGADGSLAVWYPSPQADKLALLASQELGPSGTVKAHEGEILSITVAKSQNFGPENAPLYVVSSGEDRRVVVSQLPDLSHQVARWKPLGKGVIDSLDSSFMSGSSDPQILGISGERAGVWSFGYDGRQQDANLLSSLDNLPLGTKKAAKCYVIARHPLNPEIVAVGSNAGFALLSSRQNLANFAAQIPSSGSESNELSNLSGANAAMSFAFVSGSDVWKLSYRAERDMSSPDSNLRAICSNRLRLAPALARGPANISVSPNGKHIGVVWSETKDLAIFTQYSSEAWNQTYQGLGSAIVWSSDAKHLAILHHPQVRLPEPRRAKSKKSKAKEEENAHHAALEAAKLAVQEGSYVAIYSINEGGVPTQIRRLDPQGDQPKQIFGGPVIGIVGSRSTRGLRKGGHMKMVDWSRGSSIGGEFSAPNWVSWEPELTAFALGYDDAVVIYRTQHEVSAVATLSIEGSTNGQWHSKFLCVTTPREVHGIFVNADEGVSEPFIQSIKLASIDSGITSQILSHNSTGISSSEGLKCAGPTALTGIHESILWHVDSLGKPFMIPLSKPSLRAKIASAQGDPKSAALLAEQGVPRSQHDEIALFIASMNHGPGMEAALSLTGLTLRTEMILSRRASKYRRALRCLQALASGVQTPSSFQEFPAWQNHQSESTPLEMIKAQGDTLPQFTFQQLIQHTRGRSMDGHKPETPKASSKRLSLLKFIAADNLEEESSEEEEEEPQAASLVGLQTAPNEAIDWDAPLRINTEELEQSEGEDKKSESLANGLPPQASYNNLSIVDQKESDKPSGSLDSEASQEEQGRIVALVPEGILLVDAALGYGHEDVAIATLRTLLRGARGMSAEVLAEILTRCAQCNMRDDINGFAMRIVSEGTGAGPGPSATAAALLDNLTLSHSVLQSSGLTALAAIYSHTWKTGNSLVEINDWGQYLTAASGNGVQFVVAPPSF